MKRSNERGDGRKEDRKTERHKEGKKACHEKDRNTERQKQLLQTFPLLDVSRLINGIMK